MFNSLFRLVFAFVVALAISSLSTRAQAHEARFGHGYGLVNGDRMFYGPGSGVPFMRRGPLRRTIAVIGTGNGPIARSWRAARCSR